MEQELIAELRELLPSDVHDQLVAGGEPGLTDQTLRRWLHARKMNTKVAAADLAAHAAWRQQWVPHRRVLEDEVVADLQQGKTFLHGPDRQGRGVILLQTSKHTMTASRPQQRFITYVLDGAIALSDSSRNPDDKVVAVFELAGLQLKNCDAVGLKNIFTLLQSHYVERLSQLFMLGAPAIFWGVWRVVAPFIDPVTRTKVVFVAQGDTQALLESMGPEVLPPHLGGTATLVPVDVAVRKSLQQRSQQQQQQQGCESRMSGCQAAQQQQQQQQQGQEVLASCVSVSALRPSADGHADATVVVAST